VVKLERKKLCVGIEKVYKKGENVLTGGGKQVG